jgi:DNA (cytosine-5)-methyltransferase 1
MKGVHSALTGSTPAGGQGDTEGRRPRLLDLFCCEGGAGVGYDRAGWDVTGVDIVARPRYPFAFMQADALALAPEWIAANFDAVHASPICQGLTRMRAPGKKEHPNLIPATLALLEATGLPWIIENVEGAEPWMPGAITLCGTMFALGAQGCELRRHRLFMANLPISPPGPCAHSDLPTIGVYGGHARKRSAKHGGRGTRDVWEGGHAGAASEAMGMDWATLNGMSEAIPPAYTEHLGRQLMSAISSQRLAA